MNELEQAAAHLKEVAEKIVRCAERVASYESVYELERSELERLKRDHAKAKLALVQAAQGSTLNCLNGTDWWP